MIAHPLPILKAAGWVLDLASLKAKPSRGVWPRQEPITVRKAESSVLCSPVDSTLTFRICKRGQCEDFVIPYDDIDSVRKLAKAS